MASSRSGSHVSPSSRGSHSANRAANAGSHASNHSRKNEYAAPLHNETYDDDQRYSDDYYQDYRNTNSPKNSRGSEREDTIVNNYGRSTKDGRSDASVVKSKGREENKFINFLICLITFCAVAGVGAVGSLLLVTHGPSEYVQKVFVRMLSTTATLRKIPYIFYSDEEVKQLNSLDEEELSSAKYSFEKESIVSEVTIQEVPEDKETIELIDVSGKTWKGKMLIVRDPSLVMLAVPKDAKESNYLRFYNVDEYCNMYDGIASISAGGYAMTDNVPYGFVISDGITYAKGTDGYCYQTVAIDEEGKMFVDWFTYDEIMERNPRYAVCWGPILIKDGVKNTGLGGGYTARCCIGQTADGTFLMAVIEGRMVDSIGATADDIANLMEEYGAINAINLDSGRSCVLYYYGEQMTRISAGSGVMITDRTLPNAFVVLPEE